MSWDLVRRKVRNVLIVGHGVFRMKEQEEFRKRVAATKNPNKSRLQVRIQTLRAQRTARPQGIGSLAPP